MKVHNSKIIKRLQKHHLDQPRGHGSDQTKPTHLRFPSASPFDIRNGDKGDKNSSYMRNHTNSSCI
ncbi:hypothetical protein T11_18454 [Trichinella zimbabwensis]|uniref:Uncharacterized protein n=1 Tax=Trichinella zimbabwensis TaxID=268475 RepID=A0A0V1HI67_9BILA|nr:hypothetical protein T11_18454 [Trichinella zimbabwensis]